MMEVVRTLLSSDTVSPTNIRYVPETDEIQFSPDGGTTWNDAPGLDPRHGDAYRVPPLTGSTIKCDAAANMVAALRGFVDTIISTLDYLALINAAAGWFARFIGLIGWVVSLILGIIEALLAIGRAAIDTAFTEEVYAAILCILYGNIGTDGQVSAEQLTAINDAIYADLGATVFDVWSYTMTGLGEVGLSNAGATGVETGDCGDCEACFVWDFTISDQGFAPDQSVVTQNPVPVWTSGVGWVQDTPQTPDPYMWCMIFKNIDLTHIAWLRMEFYAVMGAGDQYEELGVGAHSDGTGAFVPLSTSGWQTIDYIADLDTTRIYAWITSNDQAESLIIRKITAYC